jgi:glycolate oxidase FAD binding subunit
METIAPESIDQLCGAVSEAAALGEKLCIRGGGSTMLAGAPLRDCSILDLKAFRGVTDYDPAEMVLTTGAATPLTEIEALLQANNQMLAFEPFDHGSLYGGGTGQATIGGVVAASVCGSRRLTMGGARDHLLGFEAVSGRGEAFVGGGKVVKNVTGYDLPKVMAGSWGRLAALTQVTLKTLPRPRTQVTLVCEGLTTEQACRAMATAMASHAEVSSAAHLPADPARARTAFRLEGFPASVAARVDMLRGILAEAGALHALAGEEARALWSGIADASLLGRDAILWRVVVPPSAMCGFLAAVEPFAPRWVLDWAGGMAWLAHEGAAEPLRLAAAQAGGHATLLRGPDGLRATVPMFHPRSSAVMRLSERVRRAFDPASVFETGRFLDNPYAD